MSDSSDHRTSRGKVFSVLEVSTNVLATSTKKPLRRANLPVTLVVAAVMIAGLTFFASVLWTPLVWAAGAGVVALVCERFWPRWNIPQWVLPVTVTAGLAILASAILGTIGHIFAIGCLGASVVLFLLQKRTQ